MNWWYAKTSKTNNTHKDIRVYTCTCTVYMYMYIQYMNGSSRWDELGGIHVHVYTCIYMYI